MLSAGVSLFCLHLYLPDDYLSYHIDLFLPADKLGHSSKWPFYYASDAVS